MLDKKFFREICEFANENWKANLTEAEMDEQIAEMCEEYRVSKEEGKFTHAIKQLIYNLTDEVVECGNRIAGILLNEFMDDFKIDEEKGKSDETTE